MRSPSGATGFHCRPTADTHTHRCEQQASRDQLPQIQTPWINHTHRCDTEAADELIHITPVHGCCAVQTKRLMLLLLLLLLQPLDLGRQALGLWGSFPRSS